MMRAIDDAGQDDQPDYSEGGPKQDQERSGVRTFKDLELTKQRVAEARTLRDGFTADELVERAAAANARDKALSRDKLVKDAAAKKTKQRREAGTSSLAVVVEVGVRSALDRDCLTQDEIAAELDAPQKTISNWVSSQNANLSELAKTPPGGVARFAGLPISLRLAF